MAIAIPVPTKSYTSLLSAGGVPLAELRELLGTQSETLLANSSVADQAAWGNGRRISGNQVEVSQHDTIRISVTSSSNVVLGEWTLDVDDWRALPARAPGDDLSADGAGILVLGTSGNIRVGRTSGSRLLVQRGSFTTTETNFFINVHARLYDGGLLERRIANLRVNPVRDAVLKRRAATTPAAPTGFTFDATGQITPGSDGWILATEPDPAGSDPLWIATAHNPYDTETETYNPEAWSVVLGGSSFRQQWATDESGPWQDSPPADATRLVTRVRINGMWNVYVVRDDTAESWQWFQTFSLGANGSPYNFPLQPNSNWNGFKFIEFIMRQYTGTTVGNRRSVLIPADHVQSIGLTNANLDSPYTLNILLSEFGGGFTYGSADNFASNVVPSALQNTLRLRLYGGPRASRSATHAHLTVGYEAEQIDFVMRGIR